MSNRILLRGGHVLTMDPDLGDLTPRRRPDRGRQDRRGRAARSTPTPRSSTPPARIVIPGFVDTHRHTWEAAIRGCAPNATLDDYFVEVLDTFAPVYRPEDVYASNLAGSLECLNAGITTLVDWSHINNTPEHPDAGDPRAAGDRASGRSTRTAAPTRRWPTTGSRARSRSRATTCAGSATRTSPPTTACSPWRLATRGTGFCIDDVVTAEWGLARELDIPITVHVAMGRLAGRFGDDQAAAAELGLLGPDTTYIHCCYFSDEEWQLVADSGGTISIAPQVEVQMGHGWPPVAKAMEYGLRPSLSIDVVTTVPGDMFTQIRSAFGTDRARNNAIWWERNEPAEGNLTARQMLEIATLNGAHVAGLEDRTGSLTPGKQADVVVIDATAINVAPDPRPGAPR